MKKKCFFFIFAGIILGIFGVVSAIIPNPVVNRTAAVYANIDLPERYNVIDTEVGGVPNYDTTWNYGIPTPASPSWIAFDLGPNSYSRLYLSWYTESWTVLTYDSQGYLVNYSVQISSNSSNGTNGTWTTAAAVTNNIYHPGQISFNSLGYRWVRLYITKQSNASMWPSYLCEIDIQDISAGASDTWFFQGDSITIGAFSTVEYRGGTFQKRIYMSNAGTYYPSEVNGGIGGTTAVAGDSLIDQYIAAFPDCMFWTLNYGMNDANGNSTQTNNYRANMQFMIDRLKSKAKTPIIPRISYSSDGNHNFIPLFNKVVDDLTAINSLPPGPNLYSWFSNHPEQLSDGVHPTPLGYSNLLRLWAEAVLPLYRNRITMTNLFVSSSIITNDVSHNITFNIKVVPKTGMITNVSINLLPLAGPGTTRMNNISGSTQFQLSYTVPAGIDAGNMILPLVIKDNNGIVNLSTSFAVAVIQFHPGIVVTNIMAQPSSITNDRNTPLVFTLKSRQNVYAGSITNVSLNLSPLSIPGWSQMTNISGFTSWRFSCIIPALPGAFILSNGFHQWAGPRNVVIRAMNNLGYFDTNHMAVVTAYVTQASPKPIPGIIQAAAYMYGGQGFAYNDTTPGNSGGSYRNDDVDVENCGEGGYDVGWTANGEWMKYNVNVLFSGKYNLKLRLASFAGGGTLHLEMNGTNISGLVTAPNTGGSQNWQTVTVTNVILTAGQKIMRLYEDTGNYGYNIHWIQLTNAAPVSVNVISAVPALITNNANKVVTISCVAKSSASLITNVTINLSQIGGTLAVKMSNISGATLYRYSYTVLSGLSTGIKNLGIIAMDNSGNTGAGTANLTVVALPLPPNVVILKSPADNSYVATATPDLQWGTSTNNVTNYIVYVDGQAVKTNSWSVSNWNETVLGQGAHAWRVKVVDKAGDTNTSGTWSFTVDSIPPSAPALKSPLKNSVVLTTTPVLQWGTSTNNVTNYIVYVDGHAVKTNSSSVSNWSATVLGQGAHTWMIKAVNKAGNSSVSLTWTFTVNTLFMGSAPGVFPTYYDLSKGKKADIFCGGSTGEVNVKIYDLAGYLVRDFGTRKGTDVFTWDGKADSGAFLQPAVYIIRFSGSGFDKTVKFMLMK